MAALVQTIGKNNSKSSGTTLVITNGATATIVGNLICVGFVMRCDTSTDPGGTVSCADSAGNTYAVDVQKSNADTGGGVRVVIFSSITAHALPATTGTITITHPSITPRAAIAVEFSGNASSSALDKTSSNQDDTGNTSVTNSNATATTTQASEIVFGISGWGKPASEYSSIAAGMNPSGTHLDTSGTTGGSSTSNVALEAEYTLQTATNTQKAAVNLGGINIWAAIVATYETATATTVVFRKTLSPIGTKVGKRQTHGV
jgi:hypothetical protein